MIVRIFTTTAALACGALVGACLFNCPDTKYFFLEDGVYSLDKPADDFKQMTLTLDGDVVEIEYERPDGAVFLVTYSEVETGHTTE